MSNRQTIAVADACLFEALEAANLTEQVGALAQLGLLPEARSLRVGSATATLTHARFGRKLNHVVGFGLGAPATEQELVHIETAYAKIGCPVEIDLCPFADLSAVALLGAHGYVVNAFGNTYVHRDLDKIEASGATNAIHVRQMADGEAEDVQRWSIAGFAAQEVPRSSELLALLAISAIHRDDTRIFVAEIEGKIAGTAALSIIDLGGMRGAHLHLASSLDAFRGRGVQAALLNIRLSEASSAGARFATVTARPKTSSARNAVRAGFALAYTKPTFARS